MAFKDERDRPVFPRSVSIVAVNELQLGDQGFAVEAAPNPSTDTTLERQSDGAGVKF